MALGVAGCVGVLVLSGGGAAGSTLHGSGVSSRSAMVRGERSGRAAFTIAGSVHGLYPGATVRLTLAVANRLRSAIVVTSITTTVVSRTAGCAAGSLTVAAFAGHLTVHARRSAHLNVTARLRHATPNACQGVSFPLRYRGLARRKR